MSARGAVQQMVMIDGGRFRMGSDGFYPEERPVHETSVAAFRIDRHAVTNRRFGQFVADTGYVTVAERPLNPADFPGADLTSLDPGSLVFVPTSGPVDLGDWRQWWQWRPGASWRRPFGAGSSLHGKAEHPVVQVAYEDAQAYAAWAGCRLPTEREWEFAARGGLDGATFSWGDDTHSPTNLRANTWQGRFPYLNTGARGWVGTAPVGSFAANGYGLFDMTGNTWEWTTDAYTAGHVVESHCGCGPATAARPVDGTASDAPLVTTRVLKGGSHLCAPEYCLRYRPAARSPQTEDSATTHIGFRCAANA